MIFPLESRYPRILKPLALMPSNLLPTFKIMFLWELLISFSTWARDHELGNIVDGPNLLTQPPVEGFNTLIVA